jgi:hypothetical protein
MHVFALHERADYILTGCMVSSRKREPVYEGEFRNEGVSRNPSEYRKTGTPRERIDPTD